MYLTNINNNKFQIKIFRYAKIKGLKIERGSFEFNFRVDSIFISANDDKASYHVGDKLHVIVLNSI